MTDIDSKGVLGCSFSGKRVGGRFAVVRAALPSKNVGVFNSGFSIVTFGDFGDFGCLLESKFADEGNMNVGAEDMVEIYFLTSLLLFEFCDHQG